MAESSEIDLELFKSFKHARLYWVRSHPDTALIESAASYIPIENFKSIFTAMEELVKEKSVSRMIFDKRAMRVFHQPSMEWYFVVWKEAMAEFGLVRHVKILPDDPVFVQSVKIGRGAIDRMYPNARYHQLSIAYAQSVEEAVTK
ncbi:MAG: hypothetical protein KDC99_19735 [Cyclobacteriaceae bacterium]|nr:hypothetical protein [Cyclobacteriaceae bacterium]